MKSRSEIDHEFYQWTLREAKKQGIGQDVFLMRWHRERTKDSERECGFKGCKNKISMFEVNCPECIINGWKEKDKKSKR